MSAFDLDHVGVAAQEIGPLATAYERLGFTLTPIARHRGKNTGNRCIMLRHGYVELIAILDPAAPDEGMLARLARYHGLQIIALGIDDPAVELARLAAAGVPTSIALLERPVDDSDASGPQARFERIPLPAAPEGVLQLIRHCTREAIWQERFMTHPNGAVELEEVVLAVADPAETASRLASLAGVPAMADAVAGLAISLPRGRVRVVPVAALQLVYPGVVAKAVPCIAGFTVRTADGGAAARAILGGLPHQAVPGGLLVDPSAAGGAALLFT